MTDFKPPNWAKPPKLDNCGLFVIKEGKQIDTITEIHKQACVSFGRNATMCDIKLDHPSISRRHAIIAHGSSGNAYVMDLGSSHGSTVNGSRLVNKRRTPLSDKDVIKFGASTREYQFHMDLDYTGRKLPGLLEEAGLKEPNGQKRSLAESQKSDLDGGKDGSESRKRARPNEVICSHLLVKHKDSRRPRSWKSKTITRSKEEALEMIESFRSEIIEKTDEATAKSDKEEKDSELSQEQRIHSLKGIFAEYASKESDCNSHKRGGDLGPFKQGKMQKRFEDAVWGLDIGQLSRPIETASGIHLILRTG